MPPRYRFGPVEIRPAERLVEIHGSPAVVGARAFDLLLALIERRDRVVGKSELLDLVWPNLVVEENNLQVQVSALRKLLGAGAISTVAGRGYRFTGVLEEAAEARVEATQALAAVPRVQEEPARFDRLVLLYSDIVDSTRLLDSAGEQAMSAAWAEHDRVSRELLRRCSGREIGRSDGLLAQFGDVADAADFALAYHRALVGLTPPFQARVGIHAGPGSLRENNAADREQGATPFEVDGAALPIAARIMSAAIGGQTLLSADAAHLLPHGRRRLQSHGFWRLKGVPEPIELCEIGDATSPFVPPPDSLKVHRVVRARGLWLPLGELKTSLPHERDDFVGREAALQAMSHRFEAGARMVSVLGTGGTGKTRLAIRFGWIWLGEFPGGVWFCDLSHAQNVDGIVQAVAQGLQLPLGQGDAVAQIASALAGREGCLVILDNFEQLTRHAEGTLGQWLNQAPDARFIVTTRELLGLPGEEVLALKPLKHQEGIDLFIKRAESVRPGFEAGTADRETIGRLVDLVDGLPLAIELAAARTVAMSAAMLLQKMSDRFRVLSGRSGRHDRQSTLRKTFDWSWDLLSDVDKSALAQLSVFEGGFTLEGAEAVLDLGSADEAPWAMDVVQSLVEKSLVGTPSDERFSLLGTVQEYAREHLASNGRFPRSGAAFDAATQARHFRFFAALDTRAAVSKRCIEIDNLGAACQRAAAQGDTDSALRVLVNTWEAMKLCRPLRSGVELAAVVAAMPGLQAEQRAVADWVAGSALHAIGHSAPALERLEAGLAASRLGTDVELQSCLCCALGEWHSTSGHGDAARACLDEALRLAKASGKESLQIRALNNLGALAYEQARFDDARRHYESALALARAQGDLHWQGGLLGNLGGLLHSQGQPDSARRYYEQALEHSRQTGDRRWEGNNLCNLGLVHHDQGRYEEARVQFEAALVAARELGHPRLEGTVLCNLGLVFEAEGVLPEALTCLELAVTSAQQLGDRRTEGHFRAYLGRLYFKLGREDESRACLEAGENQLTAAGETALLALILCSRVLLESGLGKRSLARSLLERARTLSQQVDANPGSELSKALGLCAKAVTG